jgi:hypothetical protein
LYKSHSKFPGIKTYVRLLPNGPSSAAGKSPQLSIYSNSYQLLLSEEGKWGGGRDLQQVPSAEVRPQHHPVPYGWP